MSKNLDPNFILYLEDVLKVINPEALNNWSAFKGLLAKTSKPDLSKCSQNKGGF